MRTSTNLDGRLAVTVCGTLFFSNSQFTLQKLKFTRETFLLTQREHTADE